ncbi:MAG: hypothetical protein F6J98_30495 [Moorea sp. SIO4G2]|nr:hypothetical protein [Moorena sp. SIO4G2]
MPTNQGTHCLLGLGGHCPFILSANNFDIYQQSPPYHSSGIHIRVLVGIAHLFYQGTILIVISNAHPTSLGSWWALPIYFIREQF